MKLLCEVKEEQGHAVKQLSDYKGGAEMKSEEDIITLIKEDDWMMSILQSASELDLPDWWICAGFVRSKIWDTLHQFEERTQISDIDVIYFDSENMHKDEEKRFENELRKKHPDIPWSVKNEARMHVKSGMPPYTSSVDAISKFPETATALGVKLINNKQVILAAPYGIADAVNLIVKPTTPFKLDSRLMAIYQERIAKKSWQYRWHQLKILSN